MRAVIFLSAIFLCKAINTEIQIAPDVVQELVYVFCAFLVADVYELLK